MSRVGSQPISIPSGVTVLVADDGIVKVAGSKANLDLQPQNGITVSVADNEVVVERSNDTDKTKALHGLQRSLINNAIIGVSTGFKKTLKLIGTGYRVSNKGAGISLAVGYSHPVEFDAVPGITFQIEGNDTIHISGHDKQMVGQVAASIRKVRPPEPYKGKGIRYEDEVVLRKQGKAAGK